MATTHAWQFIQLLRVASPPARRADRFGVVSVAAGAWGRPRAQRWRRQVRRQWKRLREDGSAWRLAPWYARCFLGRGDLAWYQSLFAAAGDRVAGEVTPDYAILPSDRVETIAQDMPDPRIVFLIRNPIERLWSHAQMQQRLSGRPAKERVVHVLGMERPRAYGDCLTTLARWGDAFGPDRIWLGFMEDVARHPRAVLSGVTDHLGVPRHDRCPKAAHSVHKGGQETVPADIAARLATGLRDDIETMAAHLGGHARWWQWSVSQLIDGQVPQELDYPLGESVLGERHRVERGTETAEFVSGRLDEVLARAAVRSDG